MQNQFILYGWVSCPFYILTCWGFPTFNPYPANYPLTSVPCSTKWQPVGFAGGSDGANSPCNWLKMALSFKRRSWAEYTPLKYRARGPAHWQQLLINFNAGQSFVWRLSHSKYLISKHPFCRCVSTTWGAAVLGKKTVNNRSKEMQWSDGMLKKKNTHKKVYLRSKPCSSSDSCCRYRMLSVSLNYEPTRHRPSGLSAACSDLYLKGPNRICLGWIRFCAFS